MFGLIHLVALIAADNALFPRFFSGIRDHFASNCALALPSRVARWLLIVFANDQMPFNYVKIFHCSVERICEFGLIAQS
jgi:hypothetical protein